jgi:CRP-like cAMP-binding protein
VNYRRNDVIFSQGAPAEHVLYLQEGCVKLSVLSATGRMAVVGILGPGDFFGEGCLAGQPVRTGTASATLNSAVLIVDKGEMVRLLSKQQALSARFIAHMLARNLRVQDDLIDQLFNCSERRLARTLLLLAQGVRQGSPDHVLPPLSQETLAEMVGTTRSRVNLFLNKFRRLGLIGYDGHGPLTINGSRLTAVLRD